MMVMAPGMAVRAEIGSGALCFRLRRSGRRTGCRRHDQHERDDDESSSDQVLHDSSSSPIPTTTITGSNPAGFKAIFESKQARDEAGLCEICAGLSRLPAAPVAMMMVVVTMPAVPTMMVAMMPPTHFRGRRLRVFLNRRGSAGIAERQRTGALGWCRKHEHRADGGKPQYFPELHERSPWVGHYVCAESLAATLHAI
jgi:hypothetical protein